MRFIYSSILIYVASALISQKFIKGMLKRGTAPYGAEIVPFIPLANSLVCIGGIFDWWAVIRERRKIRKEIKEKIIQINKILDKYDGPEIIEFRKAVEEYLKEGNKSS